jgi:indole-3-glycerol phosphate synthase
MKDILQEIVADKRREVAGQKKRIPLAVLKDWAGDRLERKPRSLCQYLVSGFHSGIIAEFKRKSPSKGWLCPGGDVAGIIPAYEKGGASACSILTDEKYFGGSLKDLQRARACTGLPLLRKDFIIDDYQLYQSRVAGADAVLLIAAALTREACYRLSELACFLRLEVLLEIHNEKELDYVNPCIDMLGVNNRNLGTFHTDVENSFRLAERIRTALPQANASPLLVAESGISSPETVKQLREAGFRGFLIGETFMKTENPGETLSRFIQALS